MLQLNSEHKYIGGLLFVDFVEGMDIFKLQQNDVNNHTNLTK